MKRPFLFGLGALFLLAVILVSCLKDRDFDSQRSRSSGRLTLTEARETFERHFIFNAETRSGSDSEGDLLVTFDYTPLWNSADLKHDDYSSMMSVPVLTDRMISVAYFGNGEPERVAAVTQELHIVKNFDLGITIPTVKTVIPLNGRSMRPNMRALEIHDYATTRHELIIYQTLDGRRINMQLFEDGRETVHAFIGEGAESYNDKVSRIHAALEGYRLFINYVTMIGTRGMEGTQNKYCKECGAPIDPYPLPQHVCTVYVNYCKTCDVYYESSHSCPEFYCYDCKGWFKGYRYNHECAEKICSTCWGIYTGSAFDHYLSCPGLYCTACRTVPCYQSCSVCGKSHCTTNHNVGGGNGGDPPPPDPPTPGTIAPNASKIFRNSNLTIENWETLERMLEKIMADCMGGTLYNGLVNSLNGKTLAFEFNFDIKSSFFPTEGKITLNGFESNKLFHEIFHAYQAYQETLPSMTGAALNMEIEASCAQYMYLSKLEEVQPGTDWYDGYQTDPAGIGIRLLASKFDSKGKPLVDTSQIESIHYYVGEALRKIPDSPYKGMTYSFDRSVTENFKNIQNLARNC